MLDWDRVRVFHAVARAGSFTKAAERLHLSQSAVSRQISALEEDLGASLFHRHARGLMLTEQGEILRQAADEIAKRMALAQTALGEAKDSAAGHLRVNTTVGIGTLWLTSQLPEFFDRYPEITVSLVVTDHVVDLSMREADVAIRLHRPTQPDLIQRKLMTMHTHVYGSESYLERFGAPETLADLNRHRLIVYGEEFQPPVDSLNWLLEAADQGTDDEEVQPSLRVNNVYGMLRACEAGAGLVSLPDYLALWSTTLRRVLPGVEGPRFTAYFVYPEELRASKRVAVFRDFLLEKVAAEPIW